MIAFMRKNASLRTLSLHIGRGSKMPGDHGENAHLIVIPERWDGKRHLTRGRRMARNEKAISSI